MITIGPLSDTQIELKKDELLNIKLKYKSISKAPKTRKTVLTLNFRILSSPKGFKSLGELVNDIDELIIEKITPIQFQDIIWDHMIIKMNFLTKAEKRFFIPITEKIGEVETKRDNIKNSTAKIELITKDSTRNYQVSIKGVSSYYINKEYILNDEQERREARDILLQVTNIFDKNIHLPNINTTLRFVKISKEKTIKTPLLARIK